MKVTLRFLHKHRQTLKLKVNAAEDLLLNGKREPTHRGLCQHLLSKLDRARVLQASERLPPAEATELLAGIVRFAPEIPYVVRFLKCVQVSADRSQTAAALTQALSQLDFTETSAAQMRDILLLIIEVFPPKELPVFAFSLLNGEAFRQAFDRTSDAWPESLSGLLLPLRAFHRSLRRGGAVQRGGGRVALEQLREGARLLLGASHGSLLELSEPTRWRLFDAGCDALSAQGGQGAPEGAAEALLALFRSLSFRDAPARSSAVLRLASALLRSDREKLAVQLLQGELDRAGEPREARRWLEALEGTRVGNIVLEGRRRPSGRSRGEADHRSRSPVDEARAVAPDHWQRAWYVPTQRDVLVRFATPDARQSLAAHVELRRRALVPGITPVVEAWLAPSKGPGQPYLAVAWLGPALSSRLERGLLREHALAWCREACLVLAALAGTGLELPDAAVQRFSVDAGGRLWLSDLWGARDSGVAVATAGHARLARHLCLELLGALEIDVVSAAAEAVLNAESSLAEVSDALARL